MKINPEKFKGYIVVLLFITVFSCHHNKEISTNMKDKLAVTGTAQNGKEGALLISTAGEVYYIDKLESWDSVYVGKKVTVTGDLKEETYSEKDLKNEKGEWSAGSSGKKSIILNSTWKLVDNKE